MRRGDRLFEIIEILRQAKIPISAQSIGAKLGVTKRTVYRDIAALITQGVPINGEAGVGYILEPGYHMPPLMLTPEEIEAVTLGVLWVQSRGEPELALAAERLITKLETVAPKRRNIELHFHRVGALGALPKYSLCDFPQLEFYILTIPLANHVDRTHLGAGKDKNTLVSQSGKRQLKTRSTKDIYGWRAERTLSLHVQKDWLSAPKRTPSLKQPSFAELIRKKRLTWS